MIGHNRNGELLDRQPPCDEHAELMLLRAIVLDGALPDVAHLRAEHFHVERLRKIFAALATLREDAQLIDIVHLDGELRRRGWLDEIGGRAALADLLAGEALPASTADYLRRVRECYAQRQFREAMLVGLQGVHNGQPFVDVLADASRRIEAAASELDGTGDGTRATSERISQVEGQEMTWLWRDRIPLGMLTLIAGDPGHGKSLLSLDIASRVSRGTCWPDGSDCPRGRVLLLTAEDDLPTTVRPRLEAASADLDAIEALTRIEYIDPATGHRRQRLPNLELDIGLLDQQLSAGNYRLLIIDTLTSFLGRADANSSVDVRSRLLPLSALAAKHGVAVLAVEHLNKSSSQAATHRVSGSMAFVGIARAVYAVGRDHDDHDLRLVAPLKMNLAPEPATLGFRIRAEHGVPRLEWLAGTITTSAAEMLQPAPIESARDRAARWLEARLADGPQAASVVYADAAKAGHSERTLDRAKSHLGVRSTKTLGVWQWSLT
jgi:archaellum biogenesis ATPase FlaH